MAKKSQDKVAVLALVLSIVALLLSGYALNKESGGEAIDDAAFTQKVEDGINDYIQKQQKAQGGAVAANTGDPVDVSADDDPVMGDRKAPVAIIEFSDYECPFCGRFYKNTLPQLTAEYIDTGKAYLVYRDFPLSFHQSAIPAAMAANCVRDQKGDDGYFVFHDALFDNQSSGLSTENLKKWALEAGVNEGEYTDCVESNKFAAEIDKDFADGQAAGVSGTPAFFINGRKISGAQPFSVFKTIIEEELAK